MLRIRRIKCRHARTSGLVLLPVVALIILCLFGACQPRDLEVESASLQTQVSQKGLLDARSKPSLSLKLSEKPLTLRESIAKWILENLKDPKPEEEEEDPGTSSQPVAETDLPRTRTPSPKDYGPPVRMVGKLTTPDNSVDKDPCPKPDPATGWLGSRVFSAENVAEEICRELKKNSKDCIADIKKKMMKYGAPEQLHGKSTVYCDYRYIGNKKEPEKVQVTAGSKGDSQGTVSVTEPEGKPVSVDAQLPEPNKTDPLKPLLMRLKCDNNGGQWSYICFPDEGQMELQVEPAIVVPQAGDMEAFVTQARQIKHDFAINHMGGLGSLPLSNQEVRVNVFDGSPPATGDLVGYPQNGQLSHGRDVALLIRELTCPSNDYLTPLGDCHVAIDHYLVLDQERDEFGNIVTNTEKGGFFGHRLTLAAKIWLATVKHKILHPGSRQVMNISVGWERLATWTKNDFADNAVLYALEFAACNDVVTFGAAGNQGEGTDPTLGAVGPAYFESRDQSTCGQPIYAVGGVDGGNRPIASARPNGMPMLAAHAFQVVADALYLSPGVNGPSVFDQPPLTGSSMGTAAVSAIAAFSLSINGTLDKVTLVNHILHGPGDPVRYPGVADFCAPDSRVMGSCPRVHRVSLCQSLAVLNPGMSCQPILDEEPTWTEEMMDMLEGDAGIIDEVVTPAAGSYMELTPPPATAPWVCGDYSVNVPVCDTSPTYICADRQLFNGHVFTHLLPTPPHIGCDTCGFDPARDVLYVMIEDSSQVVNTAPPVAPSSTVTRQVGELVSLELKLTNTSGNVATYVLASDTSTDTATLENIRDGNFVGFDMTNVTGGSTYSAVELVQVVQGHDNQDIVVTEQIPFIE